MPTSLATFKTRAYEALGRSDTTAENIVTRGVNFACTAIALLFSPPELQTSGSVVVNVGSATASLTGLTRLSNIKKINTDAGKPVWKLTFSQIDINAPIETAVSGVTKFYARDGWTLHCRPVCAGANTLTVYYDQFPSIVSNDGDEISFSNFDDLVLSYALVFAFANLEESESAAMWQKVGEMLAIPQQALSRVRTYLEGGPISGNDTKGT